MLSMSRRTLWLITGVAAASTAGLTVLSYFYSPSLTLSDMTVDIDEGLVAVNVPLVPIAKGQSPRTELRLYRRAANAWQSGGGSRLPWRTVPKIFPDSSVQVAGFGYWLGGWQSDSRPGRFFVLFLPLWSVVATVLLTYFALRARRVKLRLWMLLALTTACALALAWLARKT
jgi:hypothetical protein